MHIYNKEPKQQKLIRSEDRKEKAPPRERLIEDANYA